MRRKDRVAPPYRGARIECIGVVVPVHDEEETLPDCLEALRLAALRVSVPVTVTVVLDACTDRSAAVVDGFPRSGFHAIAIDASNVGAAREAGMTDLLRRCGVPGHWLATTDGDSMVPRNWFAAQLQHAGSGARVVAGTVAVHDWADRSSATRDRARHEYHATPHRHVHGANLSFAASAYRATDGFAPMVCDEDVHLVNSFRANAEPIAWATDLPVVTSARRNGRAPRGFANYLSALEDSMEANQGS